MLMKRCVCNPSFRISNVSRIEVREGICMCRRSQQHSENGHLKKRCFAVSSTEALHRAQSYESRTIDFRRKIFLMLILYLSRS